MSNKSLSPLSQNTEVPPLEGWVTLTEAAQILGVTRQYSYRLAQTGQFSSLKRIGSSSTFVVARTELEQKLSEKNSG